MYNIIIVSNNIILNQLGGAKIKWNTLEHNGVMFPPEYVQHYIPVIYNGKEIVLNKDAEEDATLYAKLIDTEYIKSKNFRNNFWNDWLLDLGKDHIIKSLDDVDFTPIYNYLLKKKEEKNAMSKEEKEKIKYEKQQEEEKYKYAIVNGKKQPVGNFRIEPKHIYLGRGCNPKSGMITKKIYPEDIIINIGKDALIPEPLPGHTWKDIIHDKTVEWLASWKDNISGKMKYVWLGAASDQKAKGDMEKFDLARKLKRKIKTIHEINDKNMHSNNRVLKQISTAVYFIDKFALRIGNEKNEDEADTVGVVSLRVEHIQLLGNNTIKLDFLGKDSVRYNKKLIVEQIVYKNIEEFIAEKAPSDKLFDLINPIDVNKYLQNFMPNLTAKVFRTYNASNMFQKELDKISSKFNKYNGNDKINILLDEFNKANAKVAALCNHQKNITSNNNKQIEKLNLLIKKSKEKLRKAKKSKSNIEKIKKMQNVIKKLIAKKELKIELKNISLGTSKINYIDPRITIAFLKKHDIPIDKIFSKTLQEKFKWAIEYDINYHF